MKRQDFSLIVGVLNLLVSLLIVITISSLRPVDTQIAQIPSSVAPIPTPTPTATPTPTIPAATAHTDWFNSPLATVQYSQYKIEYYGMTYDVKFAIGRSATQADIDYLTPLHQSGQIINWQGTGFIGPSNSYPGNIAVDPENGEITWEWRSDTYTSTFTSILGPSALPMMREIVVTSTEMKFSKDNKYQRFILWQDKNGLNMLEINTNNTPPTWAG